MRHMLWSARKCLQGELISNSFFSHRVFTAAMTRRGNSVYEFGPFRLDLAEKALSKDGKFVALTPKAFDTLLILIERVTSKRFPGAAIVSPLPSGKCPPEIRRSEQISS